MTRAFRTTVDVQLRFSDTDALGHVLLAHLVGNDAERPASAAAKAE